MLFMRKSDQISANPEVAIKYTLPFEWGRLQVSEAADQAYGFVPLVPNVLKGDQEIKIPKDSMFKGRTDILILGPDEHEDASLPFGLPPDIAAILGSVSIDFAKDRSIIKAATGQTNSELADDILHGIAAQAGIEIEELDENVQ